MYPSFETGTDLEPSVMGMERLLSFNPSKQGWTLNMVPFLEPEQYGITSFGIEIFMINFDPDS